MTRNSRVGSTMPKTYETLNTDSMNGLRVKGSTQDSSLKVGNRIVTVPKKQFFLSRKPLGSIREDPGSHKAAVYKN